jgi:hypothetical protein
MTWSLRPGCSGIPKKERCGCTRVSPSMKSCKNFWWDCGLRVDIRALCSELFTNGFSDLVTLPSMSPCMRVHVHWHTSCYYYPSQNSSPLWPATFHTLQLRKSFQQRQQRLAPSLLAVASCVIPQVQGPCKLVIFVKILLS